MSSWMASFAAENTTRRLRDVFDHIQRLTNTTPKQLATCWNAPSDVDTLRRFFADQVA